MAPVCLADDIVVLGKTPVAEFTLPDGAVLKNAYTWRRSSEGLMIIHDDGNYFLNFKLLPDDWKEAYLGAPAEEVATVTPSKKKTNDKDKYNVVALLEEIPHLNTASQLSLINAETSGELVRDSLALGLLQSLLMNKRDEATRLFVTIEEMELDLDGIETEQLFEACKNCAGDGQLDKTCKFCEGSGVCPKCKGGESGEGNKSKRSKKKKKTGKSKKSKSADEDKMVGNLSRDHCTACRGTGACRSCGGDGELTPVCQPCKGAGKIINRIYCEVMRDYLVRRVNAAVAEREPASITASSSSGIGNVLEQLPGLDADALEFYLSSAYEGAMDRDIATACLLHSLLVDDMENAKRYDLVMQVCFPEEEILNIEKYLKPCDECERSGRIEKECASCEGGGKCVECEGTGEVSNESRRFKIPCKTCREDGKCKLCGGDGEQNILCPDCRGRGRIMERQRSEIKLGLVVDGLNAHYQAQ
jgi:hypothetical protein